MIYTLPITEFCDRLHLKESKVSYFINQEQLESYLEQKKDKICKIPEMIAQFKWAMQKGAIVPAPRGRRAKPVLDPSSGMLIIRKLVEVDLIKVESAAQGRFFDLPMGPFYGRYQDGKMDILRWTSADIIGSGSFNNIYKVFDLIQRSYFAIKFTKSFAKDTKNERRNIAQMLQREIRILRQVNPKGDAIGVMKPPYMVFKFSSSQQGYMTKLYDSSLYEYIETLNKNLVTKENIYRMIYQLFLGLKAFHDQNILLGDIKLENILIKYDPVMNHHNLFHADVGGAICANEIDWGANDSMQDDLYDHYSGGGAYTSSYSIRDDQLSLAFAFNQNNKERYLAIGKGRDLFALGAVIFILITKESPFLLDDMGHPNLKTVNYRPVKNSKVKELQAIIKGLLNVNPFKRTSIDVALEKLRRLGKKKLSKESFAKIFNPGINQ